MLLHLRAHLEALGAGRDHERGLSPRAQLRVDRGHDHVHVRDAAVGGPGLLPVEHPLVLGLVVAWRGCAGKRRPSRHRARTRRRSPPSDRRACRSTGAPTPAAARGCPSAEDGRHRQRRAHDRHADAGVAPEQLLVDQRQREAGRVGPELGQALEAVQADLGRLLDDRPGGLLALVPLGCGRAGPRPRRSRAPSRGCPSGPGSARARTRLRRRALRRRSWLPLRSGLRVRTGWGARRIATIQCDTIWCHTSLWRRRMWWSRSG